MPYESVSGIFNDGIATKAEITICEPYSTSFDSELQQSILTTTSNNSIEITVDTPNMTIIGKRACRGARAENM